MIKTEVVVHLYKGEPFFQFLRWFLYHSRRVIRTKDEKLLLRRKFL